MPLPEVTLIGDVALDVLLKNLEPNLHRQALRKGTRAGAKIVAAKAAQLVPVLTGTLEDTLTVRAARSNRGRRLRRDITGHSVTHRDTGAEDPFYAHFVEFGTSKWEGSRYIRPALYDSEPETKAEVRRAIREALPGLVARSKRVGRP